MLLVVASLLVLANDPAGDPPPPLPDAKKAAPRDAPGEDPTEPAPIKPDAQPDNGPEKRDGSKAPSPDAKKKAQTGEGPNKLLAAGLTAGSVCLAGPSLFCCGGGLCCFIPLAMMPVCGAAGAAGGLVASGAEIEMVPVLAATGVAAGTAAVGIGASLAVVFAVYAATGANPFDVRTFTPAGQTASALGLAVRGVITTLLTMAGAAGAGTAVYFLMPDGSEESPGGKAAKGTVEARGERTRVASEQVAMAY